MEARLQFLKIILALSDKAQYEFAKDIKISRQLLTIILNNSHPISDEVFIAVQYYAQKKGFWLEKTKTEGGFILKCKKAALGEVARKVRKAYGLNRKEWAVKLKIKYNQVWYMERENYVSADLYIQISALAEKLNIKIIIT